MKTIAVYEAKNRLSELLHAVERGEEIIITRHGMAVARLVAPAATTVSANDRKVHVQAVMKQLQQVGQGASLDLPLAEAISLGRD